MVFGTGNCLAMEIYILTAGLLVFAELYSVFFVSINAFWNSVLRICSTADLDLNFLMLIFVLGKSQQPLLLRCSCPDFERYLRPNSNLEPVATLGKCLSIPCTLIVTEI